MNTNQNIHLEIAGMTCESCARHVTEALKAVPGVINVDLPGWQSGQAYVVTAPGTPVSALEKAVSAAGYHAQALKTAEQKPQPIPPQPTPSNFHLMVIGGGSAGFAAAIRASESGFRVALVNAGEIGGTCVNIGCVPSKALIRAMAHYHQAGVHPFHGVQTVQGTLNWPQVIAHKDELVAALQQSKYRDVLAAYDNITYIEGRAQLLGGRQVKIGKKIYQPEKIVLATGASPHIPAIPGLEEVDYLTSTTAMSLRELPRSLIVLGANTVGLEQAQIFARAGVSVTLAEIMPRIAPFEDEEISAALHAILADEGLQIETDFETRQVTRRGAQVEIISADGRHLRAEQILIATGRRPNTQHLGLEAAGVKVGIRGEVLVDPFMRTSNLHIYAAGDVTGRDMFVYVAAYAGGLATQNALENSQSPYQTDYMARVTFTSPTIASAGLTEKQAQDAGYAVKVSRLPMSYVPRALVARDTRGFVKLVADRKTDRLLGAHILAPEAGEIIQIAALALKMGFSTADLRDTLFPYLTYAEALKLAALGFEKDIQTLSCCAG